MEREKHAQRHEMNVQQLENLLNQGYLESLQPYNSWVVWTMLTDKHGELKKVPFTPRTRRGADVTKPQSWDSLPVALGALKSGRYAGLGFVFSEAAPFTGIDFDHCIEDGKLKPDVEEVIEDLDSYTEYSPSKTGLHVIVKGRLPGRNIKCSEIELYDHERFFTISLNHLPGSPIDAKESNYLAELYEQYRPTVPVVLFTPSEGVQPRYSDEKVLEKAMNNPRMGKAFQRHFNGDPSLWSGEHPMHNSQSEAVWQLVLYLRFYTYGNAEQMNRLFRSSELYKVYPKWDESRGDSTVGAETIKKALDEQK